MCTLLSALPKKSRSNGTAKRKSLVLSLKKCEDKGGKPQWYRVRLLAWTSPEKNDRDDPFIERFVHQIWKKNEKGSPIIDDEVTCPVTKHVNVEGNRYDACPICKLANQYFMTLKESGWKDRDASKKNREIGRKYQAIIPVYVKDDPNYPQNNDSFKVIIFNSKKPSKSELESNNFSKFNYYDNFRSLVEKASQENCVFNGKNAVDCCFHVIEVSEVINKGQPNEYTYTHKVIDKITFTTKPYDIPKITKEWLTNSGFDDEYYTTSTPDELQAYYNRHYKISNDDIPDEDIVQIYDSNKSEDSKVNIESKQLENESKTNDDSLPDEDLDELTNEMISNDNSALTQKVEKTENVKSETKEDDVAVEDLLEGLNL